MKIIIKVIAYVGSWCILLLYGERYIAHFLFRNLGFGAYFLCLLLVVGMITIGYLIRIAILCISEVSYECLGSDHKEHNAVTADHGGRLEEVKEAIRHEKFEYLAYFDSTGNKLAEGTLLSPCRCNITTEDRNKIRQRAKEVIELHNHPGKTNSALSSADFRTFLNDELSRKMIVVTKDYNYILEKTCRTSKSGDEVDEYYNTVWSKYEWLTFFTEQLRRVTAMHKTSKHFGIKFRMECVPREPAKKHVLIIMICLIAIIFYLVVPGRPIYVHETNAAFAGYDAFDRLGYHENVSIARSRQDK